MTFDEQMKKKFPNWEELSELEKIELVRNQWGAVHTFLREQWEPKEKHVLIYVVSRAWELLEQIETYDVENWRSYTEQHALEYLDGKNETQ